MGLAAEWASDTKGRREQRSFRPFVVPWTWPQAPRLRPQAGAYDPPAFRGVLPAFAEHFRCLVLEFPGFGVSDDFGGHPMVTAFGAVPTFVDALGLEQVSIVGNSMGGAVGINYAIANPDKVTKLVTIGGIGTNLLTPGPPEGIRLLQDFTDNPSRESLIRWLESMVYDPALVTEELIEERWALATDPETLASARRMYSKKAYAAMVEMMKASKGPLPWSSENCGAWLTTSHRLGSEYWAGCLRGCSASSAELHSTPKHATSWSSGGVGLVTTAAVTLAFLPASTSAPLARFAPRTHGASTARTRPSTGCGGHRSFPGVKYLLASCGQSFSRRTFRAR